MTSTFSELLQRNERTGKSLLNDCTKQPKLKDSGQIFSLQQCYGINYTTKLNFGVVIILVFGVIRRFSE